MLIKLEITVNTTCHSPCVPSNPWGGFNEGCSDCSCGIPAYPWDSMDCMNTYGWRYGFSNTRRKIKGIMSERNVFQLCITKGEINWMEHAGDVRRCLASICDRSFDLISILGKVDVRSNSGIDINMSFFRNLSFKIDFLGQTAPPKMTAMTIGCY